MTAHYMYYFGDNIDPYMYRTRWAHPIALTGDAHPCALLIHEIIKPFGWALSVNFDPYSVMTRRDFEKLVDYYEATGRFPVHLIPDTPIKSGEPSLFLATK